MLIIKLSNESIRFSPGDGFSLSRPGCVVYKPSPFVHLLRTKTAQTGIAPRAFGMDRPDEDGKWELRAVSWPSAASPWWGTEGQHCSLLSGDQ